MWPYLKRVWRHRSLILTFAKRDLKVKYSQTFLGILWSILQPLTGILIFTFFFNQVVKIDDLGFPYALFAISGMVPWYFFSYLVYSSNESMLVNQDIIKKIYFPKLVLPLSKVLVGLVEFGISFILFIIFAAFFKVAPPLEVILFPFFVILNIIIGLSVSISLTAASTRYRDLHHIVPYLINFGIWLTPVFYPATLLPDGFSWIMYLNPMAAVIAGFRWTLLGDSIPSIYYTISFIPIVFLLILGTKYFIRLEQDIADIL